MPQWKVILYILLGGALGAYSRFLLFHFINDSFIFPHIHLFPSFIASFISLSKESMHFLSLSLFFFPLSILILNSLGSFLIGIIMAYFHYHKIRHHWALFFFVTGFLGSFTTFSTFVTDSIKLILLTLPKNATDMLTPEISIFTNSLLLKMQEFNIPSSALSPYFIISLIVLNIILNCVLCLLAVSISYTFTKKRLKN